MWLRPVLLSAACLLASFAAAATCTDDSPSCSAYNATDAQLHSLYKESLTHLQNDDMQRKRLINSQHAWQAFRDAECEYVTTHDAPSEHTEGYVLCARAMSEERIRALQHYLYCDEPNVRCSVAVP
ncbi:uncharacterized protein YecT (DUF1311 family) [Pseudomonas sp. TE3786]